VKVRYREGLAIHPDPSGGVVAEEELTIPPESCAGVRKGTGEASTGADVSLICRAGTGRRSQSLLGLAWFAYLSQLSTNRRPKQCKGSTTSPIEKGGYTVPP